MIDINPQPETQPETKPESNVKELGFTQQALTSLLVSAGILSAGETVVHWEIDRDFLSFDVKEKLQKSPEYMDSNVQKQPAQKKTRRNQNG